MPLRLGHVPGAAGSGTKFANSATTERKADWTCSQGHENKGYWLRCMETGCNEKRPPLWTGERRELDWNPPS